MLIILYLLSSINQGLVPSLVFLSQSDIMDYTLKNIAWIDCIFIPMDRAHSVTTRVWVKAWSNYEMNNEHGISHFLEHANFLWWKKYKTGNELKDFVRDIWWAINWWTWDYRTSYFINSPYEYWENQLDILWDMVVDASYPDDALENERWVVIQEIKKAKDDNVKESYYQWRIFFMWDNSYWRNILWPEENIKSFQKQDFLKYKNELYAKDNMIIVISWKIVEQGKLEELIERNFWKLVETHLRDGLNFERKLPVEHEKYIEKWINQPRVDMFIPWIPCVSDASIYCSILAEIVKRRLYQKIRQELWLCYWIRMVHENQKKYGFFLVETGLQKDKLSFWLEKINEVIDDLISCWIEEKELNSIKNSKKWSMLIDYETPSRVADFVADNYVTCNKIIFPEDRAKEFENVRMEDVMKLLPLLKRENRYTFYIK